MSKENLSSGSKPRALTIRAYQVGFGDCFLLTFHYAQADRHVLIDFGSTYKPKKHKGTLKQLMLDVARDIAAECGNKLHAVVATHRHRDHISGFTTGTETREAAGDIIARCQPDVIIQPWTEDPDAQPDARRPTRDLSPRQGFLAALNHMHSVAAASLREARSLRRAARLNPSLRLRDLRQLRFLGDDNKLANRSAIENLIGMSRREGARAFYVYYGSRSGLEEVLPGVKTYVLGPPTLEQLPKVRSMADTSPEYWELQAAAGNRAFATSGAVLFPEAPLHPQEGNPPPHMRWFIRHMQAVRSEQLLGIVRELDDYLNNTSLILLFKVGGQKFLFPGDAQIENWSYALFDAPNSAQNSARTRRLLSEVNLYKVGHHGSLNATPRTLWNYFANRSTEDKTGRLQTLVSTMTGNPHGHEDRNTEVPRRTLVKALKNESVYYTTEAPDTGTHPPKRVIRIDF